MKSCSLHSMYFHKANACDTSRTFAATTSFADGAHRLSVLAISLESFLIDSLLAVLLCMVIIIVA